MSASEKMRTIIGKGCTITGDFSAEGSARIDGEIEGDVKVTGILIAGASSRIHGNVEASSVVLGGEVLGNVEAPEKAELTSTAKLIGDIRTNTIVIDEKAIFQGNCNMNQEEGKFRKRPPRETKAGRKSAKDALKEALMEAEQEAKAGDDETPDGFEKKDGTSDFPEI